MPRRLLSLYAAAAAAAAALLASSTTTTTTDAAQITKDDHAVVLTSGDYCPGGWVALTGDPYRGRAIIRPAADTNSYASVNSAVTGNNGPSHSHSYTVNMQFSTGDECLASNNDNEAAGSGGKSMSGSMSGTDALPYVVFQLCWYNTGANPLYIAPNLMVFLEGTWRSCPAGFTSYTSNTGRMWAIATSGTSAPANSPVAAIGDGGQLGGTHSHGIPSQAPTCCFPDFYCCRFAATGCGSGYIWWSNQYWFSATTSGSSGLNIPYIQLMACVATNPSPAPIYLPDPAMQFFSQSNACPALFVESTSQAGQSSWGARIVMTWNPGAMTMRALFGGNTLRYGGGVSGSANDGHSHSFGGSIGFPGRSWTWRTTGSSDRWLKPGTYNFNFNTDGASIDLPYTAFRVCQAQAPTRSPTAFPTKFPTTFCPTKSPTTSFPTRSPSRSPTWSKPSAKPTTKPSRSPTSSKPSKSPTTSTPSKAPTTSRPSFKPSHHPSRSPTPAPVWVNVCSPADQTVFVNYDNYIVQMGACADACQVQFLQGAKTGRQCALSTKCTSLAVYTPLCKQCIIDQIVCQTNNCKSSCTWRYSDSCASCTNTNCREQFQKCSGLQGAETSAGGGTGGTNRPPPPAPVFPVGAVAGGVIGTLAALGAAFFAYKKYRERGVTVEMTSGFEQRIFGGGKAAAGAGDDLIPAAEGMESENPAYAHASKRIGGVVGGGKAAGGNLTGKKFRTRYSFHGDEEDELDVPAGADLTAIDRNEAWLVARDETTGNIGVIPLSYVTEVG